MKLTKRLAAVALAIVIACSLNVFTGGNSLIAKAVDYSGKMQYGDYLFYKRVDMDEDGTYDYIEIIECNKSTKEVIIPSKIKGLVVLTIGKSAFKDCSSLEYVEIPNNVMIIGYNAFENCSSLKNVEIPDSVTSIGDNAFRSSGLTSIDIPDSVTTIGYQTFGKCSNLTSINVSKDNEDYSSIDGVLFNKSQTELKKYPMGKKDENYLIPNSVTSIGMYAFSYSSSLISIEIPSSLTSIGYNAFFNSSLKNINVSDDNKKYSSIDGVLFDKTKSELIQYPEGRKDENYSIPNCVTSIGDYAFHYCGNLISVEIPSSVTSIDKRAFEKCSSLTSVKIQDGLKSIGEGVFFECCNLTNVEIPDSVTSIGYSAFEYCSGLTSIEIPDSVTSIGDTAFGYCSGLTSVEIPDSVTSIGYSAFEYCSSLTSAIIQNPDCEIYDSADTFSNGYNYDNGYYYNGIIRGYNGSTAQAYASKYGYKFKNLGEKPVVTTPAVTTAVTTTTTKTTTVTTDKTTVPTTVTTAKTTASATTTSSTTATNATTTLVTTTTPVVIAQKGDADGDGKLSIRDAAFIAILCAKGQYDDIPECADYNGDGKRNIRDAAAIAIYCAKRSAGKI